MDNEMILTFMMSQAQAESESPSGNVKWGHRRNFKDGKVYYHYASFLGYRKGADGLPEIDPDEAAVVRRIFARYLMGQSVRQICRDLTADGIKTAQGGDSWHDSVVQNMLKNEKYIGDALLQKTYMADLFTHEQRKNMGELLKYYVHECHPAIIDRETFQRVQEELARAMTLSWTQNVVILEAELSLQERFWYIRAAGQFGWSKLELTRQIKERTHETTALDSAADPCYSNSSGGDEDGT